MTDASEQTLVLKMSDEDLGKMYKVIQKSAKTTEDNLMKSLEGFGSTIDLLANQILDLKRRLDTMEKRIDAMEKWVESKREQGL